MNHRAVVLLFGLLLVSGPSLAGPCSTGQFDIHGIVTDEARKPLPRSRVYLLLDKVSEKKSSEQGFRAVPAVVDKKGRFHVAIDCEAYRSGRKPGEPNPCAKQPRHVTVFASADGFAAQLRLFRLKDLAVVDLQGKCSVALPELRLRPDP